MVRSSNEPRKISPVTGRRSRSFWRLRTICSRLILKNETDSPACVNTRSKNFSEKIQLAGPSNWVRPKPVRPRSFPPKQPLERKSFACYFCAGKELVSVAKGRIVRWNGHFRRFFAGKFLLARSRRDVSHLRDDSPPHWTACQCHPLLDGQRNWPAAGGSRLAELSRGAAGDAADELCRSRTAAAGRAA